jgi:hypothetical protein
LVPPLTLGELWKRYQQEAPGYRENARSTQQGKQLQARALIAFFGASKRVEDLCPNDIARYTHARRSKKRHHSGRVRRRTVHADLVFLRTMLVWATTVKLAAREWLLAENPVRGVRFPREQNHADLLPPSTGSSASGGRSAVSLMKPHRIWSAIDGSGSSWH